MTKKFFAGQLDNARTHCLVSESSIRQWYIRQLTRTSYASHIGSEVYDAEGKPWATTVLQYSYFDSGKTDRFLTGPFAMRISNT